MVQKLKDDFVKLVLPSRLVRVYPVGTLVLLHRSTARTNKFLSHACGRKPGGVRASSAFKYEATIQDFACDPFVDEAYRLFFTAQYGADWLEVKIAAIIPKKSALIMHTFLVFRTVHEFLQ